MTARASYSRRALVLAAILLVSHVGLLAFATLPIHADDHPAAATLPAPSEIASMDELIEILRRDYSGRILKIGLTPAKPPKERRKKRDDDDDHDDEHEGDDHDDGRDASPVDQVGEAATPEKWVYRVKLLTEEGYVYKLVYDAKTLELLRIRGQKNKRRKSRHDDDDD